MMMNLFSMFDPSTSLFSMNWLSLSLPFVFIISSFWKIKIKIVILFDYLYHFLLKELGATMNTGNKGSFLLLISTFFSIGALNLMALFPYVFTPSGHLILTFPLSLTLWLSLMKFGWVNNSYKMLAHMVPTGTPSILMFFMVIIEMVSNLIRPITLSVRLSANMIAGHLLLCLLGNFLNSLSLEFSFLLFYIPLCLVVLELAVSLIQAYVFMTLISLYSTEVH